MQIFCLSESKDIGLQVAEKSGIQLSPLEERSFEDREFKVRPLEEVRGKDIYIIQSLYGDSKLTPQDKFCRFMFLVGAVKDAGAGRVTGVVPYLCYARKDRRTNPWDPLTLRYIATMIEALGLDCIMCLEVHNLQAFENAFRIPTVHLQAAPLFVDWLKTKLTAKQLAVVSPDIGGVKRAEQLKEILEKQLQVPISFAILEKYRSMGKVTGSMFIGDVTDKMVLIYDDILSSGSTLVRAAKACYEHQAAEVHVASAHGLFAGEAWHNLADANIKSVAVTDSIIPMTLPIPSVQFHQLSIAPLLSQGILAHHKN